MASSTRPQYTRAKCGACGKKMAYVATNLLTSQRIYDVTCLSCKANLVFIEHETPGLTRPVWPGSLEAAALLLRLDGRGNSAAEPLTFKEDE